jgi:hypothetical protein
MTMRYRRSFSSLLASLILPVLPSWGATLQLAASPAATVTAQGAADLVVHIQVANPGLEPANVAIWQVGLALVASPGATGAPTFSSFSAPASYLLDGLSPFGPMPAFGTMLPNSEVVFADLAFGALSGGVVPAGGAAALLDLNITIAAAAAGVFYLVALPFSDSGENASSWGDFNLPLPTAFANAEAGTTIESRTLATIEVRTLPEPHGICVSALIGMAGGFTFLQRRGRAH